MPAPIKRITAHSLLLLTLLPAMSAGAQQKSVDTLLTVEKYLDYETVSDPVPSPDGRQVIYTRRWVNKLTDRWETALWMVNADGSRNRFLTKGSDAAWSRDGSRIAYLAPGEPDGTQVFVRWMDGSSATSQITRVTQTPADPRWSPDGRSIGFTMVVPRTAQWKVELPEKPKGAEWTEAPRIVETLHFRQDRRGFMEPGFRHLFIVPADGGTPRQITRGDWSVGARFDGLDRAVGWDWMPDGRTIVADGLADTTWDANYRHSNIYAVDVATGSVRRLTAANGEWSSPVVSPDGRLIAFRGDSAVRASYHASELYVMNSDGSGVRKISGDLDRDVSGIFWSSDGRGVYFTIGDRGTANVYLAPVNGTPRQVTRGDHMLTALRLAHNATATAVRSSHQSPPDVVLINLGGRGAGAFRSLTAVNQDLLAGIRLGEVERIGFTSSDGTAVEGWLVKPPGFTSTRKYPLIMEIHGGPHAMYSTAFSFAFQTFATSDYLVLYTNPRGSTGYGSVFGNAIARAYPSVDYHDLMAAVDAVIARGIVDTTRMYVGGCSGGGVLSSWVIGHTNRFAAAAVRCPVSNWMSFYGQTDVPLFTANFFDQPFWADPQPWLRQSPLMYVGNVTTPTIVMTGELDLRTPMPQSEEYYAALKTRGVPAALLRFQGEYHGTGSRPTNFIRTQLYMLSWYQQWQREHGRVTDVRNAKPPRP